MIRSYPSMTPAGSVKLVPDAELKVYPGAPHGLCSTLKDQVNEELLAFATRLPEKSKRLVAH